MGSKKTNYTIIYIVLMLSFNICCGVKVRVYTKASAIEYIRNVSSSWKEDSTGTLGYRDKSNYHMRWTPYNFKNVDWNKVKDYFGKPNEKGRSYVKNGKASYLETYIYYVKVNFDGYKKRRNTDIEILVNPITNKIYLVKETFWD